MNNIMNNTMKEEIQEKKYPYINTKDEDGGTKLMGDSAWGEIDKVRLLLQRGADVNIKNKKGEGALDIAKGLGHTGMVELLKNENKQ